MTRLAAMLTLLALAGCGPAPAAKSQAVDLGAEVTLAPGATVSVNDRGVEGALRCRDRRLSLSPRCHLYLGGRGQGSVRDSESAQAASQVEILEGGNSVVGGYRVTLVRVEPAPASTAQIAPQDYRATIVVEQTT